DIELQAVIVPDDEAVVTGVEGDGPGEVEVGVVQVPGGAAVRSKGRRGVAEHRVVEEAADRVAADVTVVVERARVEGRVRRPQVQPAGRVAVAEQGIPGRPGLVHPELPRDEARTGLRRGDQQQAEYGGGKKQRFMDKDLHSGGHRVRLADVASDKGTSLAHWGLV